MQFITRPLVDWPRPATRDRRSSSYSVGYAKTLNELERELEHLKVTGDAMIQLDMPEGDIRRDGLPYADKRPRTPRVAVAFTGKYGPMVYRCDAFHDWQSNMRAIVLGLQRLRLVAETGITSQGEQYTGFRALPPAIALGPAMTMEEAARVVCELAHEPLRSMGADTFQTLYRAAAKLHHPDAGGKPSDWNRLQEAAGVLKQHFGIS